MQKIIEAMKRQKGKISMFADGFVDEVWEIISSRASNDDYSCYTDMTDFAKRIMDSGSGGVGLELIQKRRAFGGFAANIGYASARLGVGSSLVGVFGKNNLDPVFEEVGELCNVFSLADPAVTHVFEFETGKILMSHMGAVQDISWKQIADTLGMETLTRLVTEADIIGIGYWSLLPSFNEIFDEICKIIPNDGKTRRFFFDFADFRKRDAASLNISLRKIAEQNHRFPMMLSVNEHEGAALFSAYNETFDGAGASIQDKAERVRRQIGLDELIIHSPQFAVCAASKEPPAYASGLFCEKPVRTAGAGDTFNGGYIAAALAGLGAEERLLVANAAVSYFLRTAVFPDIQNMSEYL